MSYTNADFEKSKEVYDMAELGCNVKNCAYNKEQCCCKGDIMVGGRKACCGEDTCCESFVEREHECCTNSMNRPYKNISIDCEAENCKYNHSLRCVAEHVNISGNGAKHASGTVCATFTEA